ncbi:Uncharacterized protein BM_BM17913 [Brugia malayi]|uniref:Uncharacterized protein n=1 Tax=Brugia malayi TaxID=6279 RepID=A0A4E9ERF8_BRUMA|nr:Uncharacterized protein BM_BM17913 [Brugia malayi]VIO86370.1 Uncharacterized protein BM_BM17913 [Brugia malayi]
MKKIFLGGQKLENRYEAILVIRKIPNKRAFSEKQQDGSSGNSRDASQCSLSTFLNTAS